MAEEFDPVLAEAQAQVLREELIQYDLDEEDFGLLELELDEEYQDGYRPSPPVLAIVGRPNVGKSALVNRILGRREAVVEDKPLHCGCIMCDQCMEKPFNRYDKQMNGKCPVCDATVFKEQSRTKIGEIYDKKLPA